MSIQIDFNIEDLERHVNLFNAPFTLYVSDDYDVFDLKLNCILTFELEEDFDFYDINYSNIEVYVIPYNFFAYTLDQKIDAINKLLDYNYSFILDTIHREVVNEFPLLERLTFDENGYPE